jgi:hypothetical protein
MRRCGMCCNEKPLTNFMVKYGSRIELKYCLECKQIRQVGYSKGFKLNVMCAAMQECGADTSRANFFARCTQLVMEGACNKDSRRRRATAARHGEEITPPASTAGDVCEGGEDDSVAPSHRPGAHTVGGVGGLVGVQPAGPLAAAALEGLSRESALSEGVEVQRTVLEHPAEGAVTHPLPSSSSRMCVQTGETGGSRWTSKAATATMTARSVAKARKWSSPNSTQFVDAPAPPEDLASVLRAVTTAAAAVPLPAVSQALQLGEHAHQLPATAPRSPLATGFSRDSTHPSALPTRSSGPSPKSLDASSSLPRSPAPLHSLTAATVHPATDAGRSPTHAALVPTIAADVCAAPTSALVPDASLPCTSKHEPPSRGAPMPVCVPALAERPESASGTPQPMASSTERQAAALEEFVAAAQLPSYVARLSTPIMVPSSYDATVAMSVAPSAKDLLASATSGSTSCAEACQAAPKVQVHNLADAHKLRGNSGSEETPEQASGQALPALRPGFSCHHHMAVIHDLVKMEARQTTGHPEGTRSGVEGCSSPPLSSGPEGSHQHCTPESVVGKRAAPESPRHASMATATFAPPAKRMPEWVPTPHSLCCLCGRHKPSPFHPHASPHCNLCMFVLANATQRGLSRHDLQKSMWLRGSQHSPLVCLRHAEQDRMRARQGSWVCDVCCTQCQHSAFSSLIANKCTRCEGVLREAHAAGLKDIAVIEAFQVVGHAADTAAVLQCAAQMKQVYSSG